MRCFNVYQISVLIEGINISVKVNCVVRFQPLTETYVLVPGAYKITEEYNKRKSKVLSMVHAGLIRVEVVGNVPSLVAFQT
jgi:hypothetical protein